MSLVSITANADTIGLHPRKGVRSDMNSWDTEATTQVTTKEKGPRLLGAFSRLRYRSS